jgi:hypothetical protein
VLVAKVFDLIDSNTRKEEAIWHRSCNHGQPGRQVRLKRSTAFFESAEDSPHSTGNIAQRFSSSFWQKSFWAIEMDRKMGQRPSQVVLEKSSGA